MKKTISALLIATALALASCGGVRPLQAQAQMSTAEIPAQDPEAIKELGDGYQMKERRIGDRLWILVKFPEANYLTVEAETEAKFRKGVDTALIKVFGCEAFENCKPYIYPGPFNDILVDVGEKGVYEIQPLLFNSGDTGPFVGIKFAPLPRA